MADQRGFRSSGRTSVVRGGETPSQAMSPSVDYGTLKKLQDSGVESPFLDARLEYKDVSTLLQQHIAKLFSDYRNNIVADRVYPNMMNPQASGRVGISNPPLGNFTKSEEYGPHGLTDVVQP